MLHKGPRHICDLRQPNDNATSYSNFWALPDFVSVRSSAKSRPNLLTIDLNSAIFFFAESGWLLIIIPTLVCKLSASLSHSFRTLIILAVLSRFFISSRVKELLYNFSIFFWPYWVPKKAAKSAIAAARGFCLEIAWTWSCFLFLFLFYLDR